MRMRMRMKNVQQQQQHELWKEAQRTCQRGTALAGKVADTPISDVLLLLLLLLLLLQGAQCRSQQCSRRSHD